MSNIGIALEITALGMGLVFAALILLWGMMSLLTAFTVDKGTSIPEALDTLAASEKDSASADTLRAQAVAVAVAIAIAEQRASSAPALAASPTAIVSAWQLGMRTRQMYQKGGPMRQRSTQENR